MKKDCSGILKRDDNKAQITMVSNPLKLIFKRELIILFENVSICKMEN